jgi:hypothetical protein
VKGSCNQSPCRIDTSEACGDNRFDKRGDLHLRHRRRRVQHQPTKEKSLHRFQGGGITNKWASDNKEGDQHQSKKTLHRPCTERTNCDQEGNRQLTYNTQHRTRRRDCDNRRAQHLRHWELRAVQHRKKIRRTLHRTTDNNITEKSASSKKKGEQQRIYCSQHRTNKQGRSGRDRRDQHLSRTESQVSRTIEQRRSWEDRRNQRLRRPEEQASRTNERRRSCEDQRAQRLRRPRKRASRDKQREQQATSERSLHRVKKRGRPGAVGGSGLHRNRKKPAATAC